MHVDFNRSDPSVDLLAADSKRSGNILNKYVEVSADVRLIHIPSLFKRSILKNGGG